MRSLTAILVAAGIVVALCLAAWPARTASAHPLGNFSINHFIRIDASADGIEVYRVLEMAEIPALQERQAIDTNDDDEVDEAEAATYALSAADELAGNMQLWVAGRAIPLRATNHELSFPEGEAGLRLLRVEVTFAADLPQEWISEATTIEFTDSAYADRLGWREIIARGGPGVVIADSSIPAVSISNDLTAFPEDRLDSPLDTRLASINVEPGIGAPFPSDEPRAATADATSDEEIAVRGNPDGALSRFSDLIAKDDLSAGVIVAALLGAIAFGAVHALSPGHGKTIVAAYLIGSRGTAKHALLLGLVVTATHTSTVYLVGFVALYLSQYILPEDLYPWLGIASGALIMVMGLALFTGRLRASGLVTDAREWLARRLPARRPALELAGETGAMSFAMDATAPHTHTSGERHAHDDVHEHDDHAHGHDAPHRHGFGPSHSHRIPGQDGEPVTLRSLIGLGMFGGMIPCPSAIVVMLSAIALHRVAFGLVLIVAFSVGLAGVLVAIGFALVYAQTIGQRVPLLQRVGGRLQQGGLASRLARAFPVAAAGAVIVAGLIITIRALSQRGLF